MEQWSQFLVNDSLIPANQISTDDFAGSLANQTNLAIKGIVGIKAMAEIASLVGDSARSANYSVSISPTYSSCGQLIYLILVQSIAASYVTQWQQFATSSTGKHLTLAVRDFFF